MLNELLATYDCAEATRRFALANGLDLDLARFYVAIALGESPGDVVTEAAPGSNAVVALPQPPEERP